MFMKIDTRSITAILLLGLLVLMVLFSKFLLPLAIILVPIAIMFAISRFKKP